MARTSIISERALHEILKSHVVSHGLATSASLPFDGSPRGDDTATVKVNYFEEILDPTKLRQIDFVICSLEAACSIQVLRRARQCLHKIIRNV